jgi:hypothetical protein
MLIAILFPHQVWEEEVVRNSVGVLGAGGVMSCEEYC